MNWCLCYVKDEFYWMNIVWMEFIVCMMKLKINIVRMDLICLFVGVGIFSIILIKVIFRWLFSMWFFNIVE